MKSQRTRRTLRRHLLILASALALAVPHGIAAADNAQPVPSQIVAGPGGFVFAGTYYTPAMAMLEGGSATFTNADIALHDVVAKEKRADGSPLFQSALIGLGASAPVRNVETAPQGVHEFYCSLHPWMVGRLAITPNPAGPGGLPPAPSPPPLPIPSPTPSPTPTPTPTATPTPDPTEDPTAGSWPMFGKDLSN